MKIGKSLFAFILIHLAGGTAVLGSYVYGFRSHPELVGLAWGGVPDSLRPVYTLNMMLAALGFFVFTSFLMIRIFGRNDRIAGKFGPGLLSLLYAGVLVFSTLWMPLTLEMVRNPSLPLWTGIRIVLAAVALASLGILISLLTLRPGRRGFFHAASIAGSIFFCIQTAVLDAVIWTSLYPYP